MAIKGGRLDRAIQQRLSQPGAFNPSLQGIFNPALVNVVSDIFKPRGAKAADLAPRLQQYNPPGFDPSQPVTTADVVNTARSVFSTPSPAAAPVVNTGSPAESAYQQEKSRISQLTAQDELVKKYRVADLTKAYNAATGDEKERIGLEIWATTNPRLAQKLKPGQLGYQEAQAVTAAQSPFGGAMKAIGDMQYADKISFGEVPATSFNVDLQTPLTGMQVPTIPQVGVAEAFQGTTPGGFSFAEAAKMFAPEALTQTQQALLKQAFEKGFKK